MHSLPHQPAAGRLQVALFAGLAAAAGSRSVELPWEGGTVAELRRRLAVARPDLAALVARSGVAVGDRYAADTDPVAVGEGVAIIPPVSGG